MDRTRERRIDILVVVLVLLVIVLFWMVHPHELPFSSNGREASSREAKLKRTLESIHQPAGDDPSQVKTVALPNGYSLVERMNSTNSHCAALEAYYKEEFARHGFSYTGTQEASGTAERSLSFSSQNYGASLSCTESGNSFFQTYRIVMWPKPDA